MSEESVAFRLGAVERAVEKIAEAVQEIAHSTTQIARLEERHAETRDAMERAFVEIRESKANQVKLDERIRLIEIEIPSLMEIRTQINRAVWGLTGLVGVAIIGLVIVK